MTGRFRASSLLTYENSLVLMLGVTFGVVFMDRLAVNYLAPFILPDLRLSAAQIGLASSALSVTWALSNIGFGRLSDVLGRRKLLLIATLVVFSLCSFVSGLATAFGVLIAARLFMGLAEGPVPPLIMTLMAQSSSKGRLGLNSGLIISGFMNLFATVLGPVVLIGLAQSFNWRIAFWLAAVPGLIMAVLLARYVRESPPAGLAARGTVTPQGFFRILARRNIVLCTLIGCFSLATLMIGTTFASLYLINERHIAPTAASLLLAAQGLAGIAAFLVAALSDHVGRKPAVIVFSFLGLLTPFAMLGYHGPLPGMAVLFFLGGLSQGINAVLFVVIPAETVPLRQLGTVTGFIPGMGELIGSVFGPAIAGWAADLTTLAMPFYIMGGCSIASGLLALGLKECVGVRPPDPLESAAAMAEPAR
ncbi:MAG TPA: MFS transporter [Steroidobacteraceae bacterium]|nr:MFS transporter [Steroidobacteraceae bacterium]